MKLLERKQLAWQYWLGSRPRGFATFCRFTNVRGWAVWTPIVSILSVNGSYLVIFDPQERLGSWSPKPFEIGG